MDGAAGHADRALNDLYIFLACADIALFELVRGVAFLGGHETRAHLYALGPERRDVVYVLARIYSSAGDYRNMLSRALLRLARLGHNLRQDMFEGTSGVVQLLCAVAEVSAGFGPFDDDGVGHVSVLFDPAAA